MNRNMPPGNGGRGAPLVNNLIEELVEKLTCAIGRPTGMIYPGHAGNAIGRDNLDAIVSELLRQVGGGGGPPPLPKVQIEKIPLGIVTQNEINGSLQCAICYEIFQLGEQVRKLKCKHMYHDKCITRWLEQHGTCPICRKDLANGGDDDDDDDDDEDEERPRQTSRGTMTLRNSRSALRSATENGPGCSSVFSTAPSSSSSSDSTLEGQFSSTPNFD